MTAVSAPLPDPTAKIALSASIAGVGVPVQPHQRLQIMEPSEWEQFILEWADSLRQTGIYTDVHRCGGKGDQGRDVIGFKGPIAPNTAWDNYQCKHYAKALSIADTVREIGKLFFYASEGSFPLPEKYLFVSPKGPSTELLKCLQKGLLKKELLSRWDSECRKKITLKHPTELTDKIKKLIENYDFARIEVLPPARIIEGHRKTPYHVLRFGGGLPGRAMPTPKPPTEFLPEEAIYLKKLLDAYADEKKTTIGSLSDVEQSAPEMTAHFHNSREQFFSAESLRTFSRDNVPPGTFNQLQDEVFDGVQETYQDSHSTGFRRVVETVKKSRDIQLTGNPLVGVLHTNDRAGICHQLANDDRMTWVRKVDKK